jgi:uncharacterized membrane protein
MSRPAWVVPASFTSAIAGTAVSIYLTIAHFTSSELLACASDGAIDCGRVTASAQSEWLGVPVALLGLAWFLAMSALCSPWAWRSSASWIRLARLAAATTGIAFVLWLVYAELFVIHAICLWCTVVHVLAFALFVIVVLYGTETAEGG